MDITIILAQFGERHDSLEPGLSSYRRYFPDAHFVLYTDREPHGDCGWEVDDVKVVKPPFDWQHPRYGYRCNDYYKVFGLLEEAGDVRIAVDADTRVVSENVAYLPELAMKFGLCLPANPRLMVRIDTAIGADSDGMFDLSGGYGYAMNMTPIAFAVARVPFAMYTLNRYIEIMESKPVRGPLAMWRACYATGFSPCLLPPQWCVCQEDIGIGDEIILHVGHEKVREHYGQAE